MGNKFHGFTFELKILLQNFDNIIHTHTQSDPEQPVGHKYLVLAGVNSQHAVDQPTAQPLHQPNIIYETTRLLPNSLIKSKN